MNQQTYPVGCECGKEHAVTGGQAGSAFDCACGRQVEVPTLGALKRSVGQSAISADLEIEYRLTDGSLPEGDCCVLCNHTTRDFVRVGVVCERSEVRERPKLFNFIPIPLLFVTVWVKTRPSEERRLGRDVAFHLPVRVCDDCRPQVRSSAGALVALRQTPVYARLLVKYPHAEITPPRS